MASGQQVAEENFRKFTAWTASKTDDDFRNMTARGVLSRTDIAAECGFAKSALSQNPRVRECLRDLEQQLRARGVLPQVSKQGQADLGATAAQLMPSDGARSGRDAERLKRLEHENASLRAELAEVKLALSRYALLQEALAETGRLLR